MLTNKILQYISQYKKYTKKLGVKCTSSYILEKLISQTLFYNLRIRLSCLSLLCHKFLLGGKKKVNKLDLTTSSNHCDIFVDLTSFIKQNKNVLAGQQFFDKF